MEYIGGLRGPNQPGVFGEGKSQQPFQSNYPGDISGRRELSYDDRPSRAHMQFDINAIYANRIENLPTNEGSSNSTRLPAREANALLHILKGRRELVGCKPQTADLSDGLDVLMKGKSITAENRSFHIENIMSISHSLGLEHFWRYRFQYDQFADELNKHMLVLEDHLTVGDTSYLIENIFGESFVIRKFDKFQEKTKMVIYHGEHQILYVLENEIGIVDPEETIEASYKLLSSMQRDLKTYEQSEKENTPISDFLSAVALILDQENDKNTAQNRERRFQRLMLFEYVITGELEKDLQYLLSADGASDQQSTIGKSVGRSRKSEKTIQQTASNRRRHRRTRPPESNLHRWKMREKRLRTLQAKDQPLPSADEISPAARISTEIELINNYLDYIEDKYPEIAHKEESTLGAELEPIPNSAGAQIDKAFKITSEQLQWNEIQIVRFLTNIMSRDAWRKELAACFEIMQTMNETNREEILDSILPHFNKLVSPKSDVNEEITMIGMLNLLYQWGKVLEFPILEDFENLGTFTYGFPHIIGNGGFPPVGRAEIQLLPAYNDKLLSREIEAYVRLGLIEGDVFPQFTTDIKLDEEHTEIMIAHAIGIAAGAYGLTFTEKQIHEFQMGLDYWHEPYPKLSPNIYSNTWIPRHKSREGLSDKTGGPAMYPYETSHEYGCESRIFKRWDNTTVIATENPYLNIFDESHWVHDFELTAFYEKNTSTVILAVQTDTEERSNSQHEMNSHWDDMLDDFSTLLQSSGIKELTLDQYIVKNVNTETWYDNQHKKSPYEGFVTKIIVKRYKDKAFKTVAEKIWNTFQEQVSETRRKMLLNSLV